MVLVLADVIVFNYFVVLVDIDFVLLSFADKLIDD
jgi:hypothetical protein